jgi:hypothetical protein
MAHACVPVSNDARRTPAALTRNFDEDVSECGVMHSGESNCAEHKIAEVCVIHSAHCVAKAFPTVRIAWEGSAADEADWTTSCGGGKVSEPSSESRHLRRTLEQLFASQSNDQRLRDHLEGLQRDPALGELTPFWGPLLYQRNRALFRPFILSHFTTWAFTSGRARRLNWSDNAPALDAWLAAAREARDTALVRRLLPWKYASERGGVAAARWFPALLADFTAASNPAARRQALEEYANHVALDEDTALALYRVDRQARDYILHRLPSFWDSKKEPRAMWWRLGKAVQAQGDEDFYFKLYRRLTAEDVWARDVLKLVRSTADAATLNDELERRHLEGWNLTPDDTVLELLRLRGREIMPYVRSKLSNLIGGWRDYKGEKAKRYAELAAQNGWWDLWAAAIRCTGRDELFNSAVSELLRERSADPSGARPARRGLVEAEIVERLRALAGVSLEWNWPGFGLAVVHSLKDDLAAELYERYPRLVHGPFKPHVLPRWHQGFPKLLAAVQKAGDEDFEDLLASRYVTRAVMRFWRSGEVDKVVQTANELGDRYEALRQTAPEQFARRAANVLTQVPAYSIWNYDDLLKSNKLARLLFVRSFDIYLEAPRAVGDLVEGSDIHVMMLAYSILALDDDRARALAVAHLDLLLGTLFRVLHRKTRLPAFRALANAAKADPMAAARILARVREAFKLPDKKYPKERLTGLAAAILRARPELQSERERPVIYRHAEKAA